MTTNIAVDGYKWVGFIRPPVSAVLQRYKRIKDPQGHFFDKVPIGNPIKLKLYKSKKDFTEDNPNLKDIDDIKLPEGWYFTYTYPVMINLPSAADYVAPFYTMEECVNIAVDMAIYQGPDLYSFLMDTYSASASTTTRHPP